MLNPELTIRNGLELIGKPQRLVSWEIQKDDEIMKVYQSFRESLEELFRNGDIRSSLFGIEPFNKNDSKSVERFESSMAFQKRFVTICRDHLGIRVSADLTISEALTNAIEHGVNYGKKGSVTVKGIVGDGGELWAIEQPTDGVDLKPIKTKADSNLKQLNRDTDYEEKRGCGLAHFASKHYGCDIWYKNLEDGGYRLIILSITEETRRALLSDEERLAEDCKYWSGQLSWSLAQCHCGLDEDPRIFYEAYFSNKGVTLDFVLSVVRPKVKEMYEANVQGYLDYVQDQQETANT